MSMLVLVGPQGSRKQEIADYLTQRRDFVDISIQRLITNFGPFRGVKASLGDRVVVPDVKTLVEAEFVSQRFDSVFIGCMISSMSRVENLKHRGVLDSNIPIEVGVSILHQMDAKDKSMLVPFDEFPLDAVVSAEIPVERIVRNIETVLSVQMVEGGSGNAERLH